MTSLGTFHGVALITGGGSGLGQASAVALAAAGARLILVDISQKGLEETKALCKLSDDKIYLKVLNLTDRKAMQEFIRSIPSLEGFGRLDYCVASAGVAPKHDVPIGYTTEEGEDFVYEINLIAQHHLLREVVKVMLAQEPLEGADSLAAVEEWRKKRQPCKGSIVNFASWSSFHGSSMGQPAAPSYPTTKHAIHGLTKAIGAGHAKDGLRCNAVCPGPIATPILGEARPDMLIEFGKQFVPAGRVGIAGEVADAVLFLLSERSWYINGTTLCIDGGLNAQ